MGVIDYNLAFKQIAPSYFDSARKGIELGNTIRNAPILRKLNEQRAELNEQNAALNEQKLTEGNINTGESEAMAIFRLTGNKPITPENYLANVQSFKRAGLPVQQQDLEVTPENIAAFEQLRQYGQNVFNASQQSRTPGSLVEFNTLTEGMSPEDIDRAKRIELGLDPRAVGSSAITIAGSGMSEQVGDSQKVIKTSEAEGTTQGTKQETRAQDIINQGVAAAESTAILRRSIDLLGSIETGGFDNAALRAKQVFGVEGADEGELSNAMGKAVLSQLRETFGAAFTQEEGKRLERIEAGFGKSPATNIRLLKQALRLAERKANRARKLADERGDTAIIEDIDDLLSFDLSETVSQSQGSEQKIGGYIVRQK